MGMVDSLLELSQPGGPQAGRGDLNGVLDEVLEDLGPMIAEERAQVVGRRCGRPVRPRSSLARAHVLLRMR